MSKYGHRTGNWFESIVNKMGGEERAKAFLRGDLMLLSPLYLNTPIWRTIKLGLRTPSGYQNALMNAGIKIQDDHRKILPRIPVCEIETELDLVLVLGADLGLKDTGAGVGGCYRLFKYEEACTNARNAGFELCPAEVGPALRLECSTEPPADEEHLHQDTKVMMEPIDDTIFGLWRDRDNREQLYLNTTDTYHHCITVKDRLVLVRPKLF